MTCEYDFDDFDKIMIQNVVNLKELIINFNYLIELLGATTLASGAANSADALHLVILPFFRDQIQLGEPGAKLNFHEN